MEHNALWELELDSRGAERTRIIETFENVMLKKMFELNRLTRREMKNVLEGRANQVYGKA